MTNEERMVRAFHEKFGVPVGTAQTLATVKEAGVLLLSLIADELGATGHAPAVEPGEKKQFMKVCSKGIRAKRRLTRVDQLAAEL